MLAAAWVLQVNGHIRIELLSTRFSSGLRRAIEIAGHALLIVPFAATMLWLSLPYFLRSWAQGETSINTGGLLIWPMRGIICWGFLLLLLQSLACLVRMLLGEEAPQGLTEP
jgi:TRAP-type mannitol/chloroaromatic compound transport system permease small subunit